jgi:hypothetical protein
VFCFNKSCLLACKLVGLDKAEDIIEDDKMLRWVSDGGTATLPLHARPQGLLISGLHLGEASRTRYPSTAVCCIHLIVSPVCTLMPNRP